MQARAYLVADGRDGHVLAADAPRQKLPIASITKLMTVLVALEQTKPTDVVTVSPPAARSASRPSISKPASGSPSDLIEASLIQSANDAAWALAYHVGRGDAARFVRVMNISS